ncbi:Uncharacterised protein [uncultured Blautia sp.]|nr:Uncharacterised protein [uncultured Blautia sp.]
MSSPGWPTMAMGWVMGTVSPSGCRIFSTVPVAVESMVMVSLSVSISKRGAPSVVCSPSFASHLVMVPSSIKRPCLGMIMTEAMSSAPFSAVQGRLAGVHDILHAGQHRLFQPQVKGKGAGLGADMDRGGVQIGKYHLAHLRHHLGAPAVVLMGLVDHY